MHNCSCKTGPHRIHILWWLLGRRFFKLPAIRRSPAIRTNPPVWPTRLAMHPVIQVPLQSGYPRQKFPEFINWSNVQKLLVRMSLLGPKYSVTQFVPRGPSTRMGSISWPSWTHVRAQTDKFNACTCTINGNCCGRKNSVILYTSSSVVEANWSSIWSRELSITATHAHTYIRAQTCVHAHAHTYIHTYIHGKVLKHNSFTATSIFGFAQTNTILKRDPYLLARNQD